MPSIYSAFDEYEDEKVLRAYLTRNYKAAFMTDEEMEFLKNTHHPSEKASKIHENIMDRMIENLDKINVNRCPECNRILETPRSRQCLWCKYKFHEVPRPEPKVKSNIELKVDEEKEPPHVHKIRVHHELVDEDD